jgi:hypothetical protein
MQYKYSFLTLFLLTSLLGCHNHATHEHSVAPQTIEHIDAQANQLNLQNIPTVPPEIYGCGCALSLNDSHYNNAQYICVDNYEVGFLFIDGKLEKFEVEDIININDTTTVKTMKNDAYQVTLRLDRIKLINDETWSQKGFIEVKSKHGIITKQRVSGTCGC